MIRGLRTVCLLGGALLLPLFASAHNGEWLLAKCTIGADNNVTVRITADAEANPRIKTEADLVRETKGTDKLDELQWESEGWKIKFGTAHFEKLGVDYLWGNDPKKLIEVSPDVLGNGSN